MFESLTTRERELLDFIMDMPNASVAEMAEHCGVSEVTIRAMLREFEKNGLYIRSHGGGMPSFHPLMLKRIEAHHGIKLKLAKAAAALIEDGDDLMLVGGTTTSFIPRYLYGRRNVKIITNSTLLMPYARTNEGVEYIFTGGEFRPDQESLVGAITLRQLRQFHVKTVYTGMDGFMPGEGYTADSVEIAEIVRTMCDQADRTVIVTDSDKFARPGFATMLSLRDVDLIVTDDGISEDKHKALAKAGVELRIVDCKEGK